MSNLVPGGNGFEKAYERVRFILAEARNRAYQAINSAMIAAYWEVGRTIVEEEQHGKERADYGRRLLKDLSNALSPKLAIS